MAWVVGWQALWLAEHKEYIQIVYKIYNHLTNWWNTVSLQIPAYKDNC